MKGWTAGSVALLVLGLVLAGVHAWFALVGRAAYVKMYADFGSALPLATEVALHPVTSPLVAAMLASGLAIGAMQARDRTVILAIVAGLAVVLAVVLGWATTLPFGFWHQGGVIK